MYRALPPTTLLPIIMATVNLLCILSLVAPMQVTDVDSKLCSFFCQCTSNTVDCNHQDKLSYIPRKISIEYKQLHISHASFVHGGLTRENFSAITDLTSLKIVYSRLDSLHDDTFIMMTNLQYLDLSHNHFTMIAPGAFNGLTLSNLYLESNLGGLVIAPTMFEGLKVTNLHLRSNKISHISVKPFEQLNTAKLYLFNNSITTVDRRFEALFSAPDKLLDLTKNPLHCSCSMSWFPDLIRNWRQVQTFVNITCHLPNYLHDQPLSNLSKDKFPCETPSINKISVDVADNFLQLVCHAKGNASPKISWTQINPDTGGEIPYFEEVTSHHRQSYVAINVSKLQHENSFICRTWNEINSSNQVLVKLKVVDDFFGRLKKPLLDENFKSQLPRNPNPIPETHFLFTKQFSILQMIGAVVGTFTGVVVLIFIICCSQEHFMKKNPNSNTYWTTIPSDVKSSYNRVVAKPPLSPNMVMVTSTSSQDYDIPQYHESNNFLQSYYTERNGTHYTDEKPAPYCSTTT